MKPAPAAFGRQLQWRSIAEHLEGDTALIE
jgi:hypothetical protein